MTRCCDDVATAVWGLLVEGPHCRAECHSVRERGRERVCRGREEEEGEWTKAGEEGQNGKEKGDKESEKGRMNER